MPNWTWGGGGGGKKSYPTISGQLSTHSAWVSWLHNTHDHHNRKIMVSAIGGLVQFNRHEQNVTSTQIHQHPESQPFSCTHQICPCRQLWLLVLTCSAELHPPPPPLVFCFTHSFLLPYNTGVPFWCPSPLPPPQTSPLFFYQSSNKNKKRPSCFMATAPSSFSVTRTSWKTANQYNCQHLRWKTANQYNCQHLRNLKNAHSIVHAQITSVHTDTRPKTQHGESVPPGKTTDSSSQTGKSSSGKPRLWSSGTIRLNGQPNTPIRWPTPPSDDQPNPPLHLMTRWTAQHTLPSDNPPLHLMTRWTAQHTPPSDDTPPSDVQMNSLTHPSIWWPPPPPPSDDQPNTRLHLMTHPSIWWPDEQPNTPLHLITHPSIWWPDGQPNTPLHLMTHPSIWWPDANTCNATSRSVFWLQTGDCPLHAHLYCLGLAITRWTGPQTPKHVLQVLPPLQRSMGAALAWRNHTCRTAQGLQVSKHGAYLMSTETTRLIRDEEGGGGRGHGSGGRGRLYTYRYAVTTTMTPALRWAVMRAILMFH